MNRIRPKKLNHGDVIGIISPASSIDDFSRLENATKYFEKLGYLVKIGKNVGKKEDYLAGNDEERLSDFHQMFEDKDVKAIFSLRGGYGSARLLDKINYSLIRKNPKILVGYSDITALHLAIFKKTSLITFAGLMASTDFGDEINQFAEEQFWRILTSKQKVGIIKNPENDNIESNSNKIASGILLGGNLSVLTSIIGSKYLPDFSENILLLEDVDEKPYRIDRMLNQMRLANILEKVNGFVLGKFTNCFENDENSNHELNKIFSEYLGNKKPVIYNLSHGHIKFNLTLPIGSLAKINGKQKTIEILESVVS